MSLRFLFIDLDSYFASCEQQLHPELRGHPIAVIPTNAETTCCIAASYEAKAFGVKTGTKVFEARKLCPKIRFVVGNHEAYIKIHHRMIDSVERCIPVTAVKSIDELYAELPVNWRNEEKAREIAFKIRETLAEDIGPFIGCSIGIAPNLFLSKTASGMRKPRGFMVIHQEDLPDILYTLKLGDIHGVGKNMERRLNQAGIHTVQQLCNAPLDLLRQVWNGTEGERLFRELRGEQVNRPETQTRQVGHSRVLPPELRHPEGGFEVLHQLIQKAAVRLRRKKFYASRMSLRVRLDNRTYWQQEISFFETQHTPDFLYGLRKLWGSYPQDRCPIKVSLVLGQLVPENLYTPSLFTRNQDLKNRQLIQAVDKLNQQYGSNALHYLGNRGIQPKIPTRIAFTHIPHIDHAIRQRPRTSNP